MKETEFLDQVSETYRTFTSPISKWSTDAYINVYQKNINLLPGNIALEMGVSDGYSTKILSGLVEKLDVVDGSKKMLEKIGGGGDKFTEKCNVYIFPI